MSFRMDKNGAGKVDSVFFQCVPHPTPLVQLEVDHG